jgi:hypothetical protein
MAHVGTVAPDQHGAQRRAAVVEQPAADDGTIAPDHDLGQHQRAALVPERTAEIGLASSDRHARDGHGSTLEFEHPALAPTAYRQQPGAWEEAMRDLDAQRPHRKLFD